ncbi:hypothetical protein N0V94_000304 [Neodidymelliopsis sp. IMI 364377]|nr:hypothetical protein N0V94_000304 [Neodidymelliopsis sp. IMI 364377]
MAGEEYARVPSWGMHGDRRNDFETVSPCTYLDLPQSLLELLLIKWATTHGWLVRWDTKLMEFSEECNDLHDKRILAKVLDQITGVEYTIRTRFLFGADGGRSVVAQQLGLPFTSMPGGALAHNVLVRAEFGHLMPHREGNLHMIPRLDKDYPFVCVARMTKPWGEWMFVFFPKGLGVEIPKYSREEWKAIVSDLIGDSEVAVEVVHMASWMINETSADTISKGNVFCLGDAIHRHPPTLGLGSSQPFLEDCTCAPRPFVFFPPRNL